MKKTEVLPLFKMSYASLMQLGDKAVDLIARDAAELAGYGVDAAAKQFIEDKTQELKDFPTDEEYEGAVSVATETKDGTADEVKVAIRSIMVRAKNGFTEKSGKYRRFGTKGMDELTDKELITRGKRVVRIGTIYLAELASKGLTALIITGLNTLVLRFDDELDAQDDAIRVRDIATEDRLELGNVLYAKIVEVFGFGKDYWVTRNESKYNDYVIYDTASGSEGEVFEDDILSPAIIPIDTTGVTITATTAFFLEAFTTATRYYFISTSGGTPGPSDTFLDVQPGQTAAVTAAQLGFNATKTFLHVQNVGMVTGHYKITIG